MPLMGYRQYARHRKSLGLPGGTHHSVQQAVSSGRIKASADKRIDSDQADQAWAAATDAALQRNNTRVMVPPPPALPILDGELMPAPAALSTRPVWDVPFPPADPSFRLGMAAAMASNLVDGDSFMEWKRREQRANALAAERDLEKESGKLIDADEARAIYRQVGKMFAQMREALPTQLGPDLVGLTDPREIERRIRDRFRVEDLRIANEIQLRYGDVLHAPFSVGAGC